MRDWRPIEEAPREHGAEALLFSEGKIWLGYCEEFVFSENDREFVWYTLDGIDISNPTHWMPLPDPPEAD